MIPSTISEFDVDARFAEIIAAEWPKLEGRQTPEALLYTAGGDPRLGLKAAELGLRSAHHLRAMPFQAWSLEHIMSKNADDTWTHPECCLIVPRQAGKSTVLILRVLYGLFKLGENIVFSAHQWVTAKALWRRCWQIVESTPWMKRRVDSKTCSQGRGTIELKSGATVVFSTRSAHLGRGLDRVDLEIYDEAYDLTEADMAALSPTKMAAPDPQTIYTSSAVNADQHTNGHVLAAVRRRGLAGTEDGLFFAEWMAPTGLDRADHETWRLANPSYGVIARAKVLDAEFKKFSTAAGRKSFDVEYLGWGDWPVDPEDGEAVIDPEVWSRMTDTTPSLRGPVALAIDRSKDGEWWAIAAAQATDDGRMHLEVGYCQSATADEVVAYALACIGAWDPCVLVIDRKSPANVLEAKLLPAGVEPEMASTPQVAVACRGFYDDATSDLLSHTGQQILTDAVAAAAKREMPQGDWAWDRSGTGVVSPLIAATLAHWGLLTFGAETAPPPSPSRGTGTTTDRSRSSGELDVFAAAF